MSPSQFFTIADLGILIHFTISVQLLENGSVLDLGLLIPKFRFQAMYLLGNTLFVSESIIQNIYSIDIKFSKEQWLETCQGDEQCLYDSAAMGSLEVGERTRQAHAYYALMQENMKFLKNEVELRQV